MTHRPTSRQRQNPYLPLKRQRRGKLAFERLEPRRMLVADSLVTFARFSIAEGPSAAHLFRADQSAVPVSETCFIINGTCETPVDDFAWSPTGDKLLIASQGSLMVMNADGSQLRPIQYENGQSVRGLTPTWVGFTGIAISFATADFPTQSSSNFDIAYTTLTFFEDHIVAAAPKNLSNHFAGDFHPSWNPAGTSFVYESYSEDGAGDILRVDDALSATPIQTNLTATRVGIGDFKPEWSRDGSKIVFASNDGKSDIWVMDADGSNLKRLTNDAASDDMPSWSADGSQIVFSSSRSTPGDGGASLDPEIFVMDSGGLELRPITSNGNDQFEWNPAFRPTPQANLSLDIRDLADPIPQNGVVEYRIRVKNGGFSRATGVVVRTEPFGDAFIFEPNMNPPQVQFDSNRRIVVNFPDLDAGEGGEVIIKLRIPNPGRFSLFATVEANELDPVLINNTTFETTDFVRTSDAVLDVQIAQSRVTKEEAVRYNLVITNEGVSAALDVDAHATLPDHLIFTRVSTTLCQITEKEFSCHFDEINVGTRLTFSVFAKLDGDLPAETVLATTFSLAVHGTLEQDLDNNEKTQSAVIAPSVDSDGDGLFDAWELRGVDNNQDGIVDLDLPALGADVRHKELFVEVDYMGCVAGGCGTDITTSYRPLATGLNDVKLAFASASVTNPDGVNGIDLQLVVDEAVPFIALPTFRTRGPGALDDFNDLKHGSNDPANLGKACGIAQQDGHFGSAADRTMSNCEQILAAKSQVFRYAIFGRSYFETPGSSGIAELPGNDFMVTVGAYSPEGIALAGGQRSVEAGTFMHEFGHTLGLRHGGGDHSNNKPNYISVMNYDLQFANVISTRTLDYSRSALNDLDEGKLNELTGVISSSTQSFAWRGASGGGNIIGTTNVAIDWNQDTDTQDASVVNRSLNNDPRPYFGELDATEVVGTGLKLDSLIANSPAVLAGLLPGDIVTDFGSQSLAGATPSPFRNFYRALFLRNPGDSVVVKVLRGTQTISATVVLTHQVLKSYDDWSNIVYDFRASPDFADGAGINVRSTVEIDEDNTEAHLTSEAEATDFDGDGFNNRVDNCAAVSNADQSDSDNDGIGNACEPTDHTAPQLTGLPINQNLPAAFPEGAIVNFVLPTATDDTLAATVVDCNVSSGTLFPIGSTREVTCSAMDDAGNVGEAKFSVRVFSPWQNQTITFDVDHDNAVQPLDALLVINELNSRQLSSADGALPIPASAIAIFLDITGDGKVFPLDALLVINEVNRMGASEPDAVLLAQPYSLPESGFLEVEEDLADLAEESLFQVEWRHAASAASVTAVPFVSRAPLSPLAVDEEMAAAIDEEGDATSEFFQCRSACPQVDTGEG